MLSEPHTHKKEPPTFFSVDERIPWFSFSAKKLNPRYGLEGDDETKNCTVEVRQR